MVTMKTHFQSCYQKGLASGLKLHPALPPAFRQGFCLGDEKPELPSTFPGQKTTDIPGITAFRVLGQSLQIPAPLKPVALDLQMADCFLCSHVADPWCLPLKGTLTPFLQGPAPVLSSTLAYPFKGLPLNIIVFLGTEGSGFCT